MKNIFINKIVEGSYAGVYRFLENHQFFWQFILFMVQFIYNFEFMHRFLSLFILLSIFFVVPFALWSNDMTSPDYMVDVHALDPTWSSQNSVFTSDEWVSDILKAISKLLLILIPIIAGISGVIAGYFFVFSWGDTENVTKAKWIIRANIIAIIIALFSYSLISFVAWVLQL